MNRKTKIILIAVLLIILGSLIIYEDHMQDHAQYKVIGKNNNGTVEKIIYGNESADKSIALITGIHPREKLAIDPELQRNTLKIIMMLKSFIIR